MLSVILREPPVYCTFLQLERYNSVISTLGINYKWPSINILYIIIFILKVNSLNILCRKKSIKLFKYVPSMYLINQNVIFEMFEDNLYYILLNKIFYIQKSKTRSTFSMSTLGIWFFHGQSGRPPSNLHS